MLVAHNTTAKSKKQAFFDSKPEIDKNNLHVYTLNNFSQKRGISHLFRTYMVLFAPLVLFCFFWLATPAAAGCVLLLPKNRVC